MSYKNLISRKASNELYATDCLEFLKSLDGYSPYELQPKVNVKNNGGDLYVTPCGKNKKPKETEAR